MIDGDTALVTEESIQAQLAGRRAAILGRMPDQLGGATIVSGQLAASVCILADDILAQGRTETGLKPIYGSDCYVK